MTNQEYIECMEESMVQFKLYHHRIKFIDPKYGFESILAYKILNKLHKGTLINKQLSTLEYLAFRLRRIFNSTIVIQLYLTKIRYAENKVITKKFTQL